MRKNKKQIIQNVDRESDFQILARIQQAEPANYKELKKKQKIINALEIGLGLQLYNMKLIDNFNYHDIELIQGKGKENG